MKVVTIGGLPAAGKTYTSKLIAKQYNCISLEFESLRWDFFNENIEKNLYEYTNHEKKLQNENLREYYMRCTLYSNLVPINELVKWHENTMKYIKNNISHVLMELSLIKCKKQYDDFFIKYKKLINYIPNFEDLNKEIVICSHAFINTIDFMNECRICIDFFSDKNVLLNRFKARENIKGEMSKNLAIYYLSYEKVLKKSIAFKLDTTDINIIDIVCSIINNK